MKTVILFSILFPLTCLVSKKTQSSLSHTTPSVLNNEYNANIAINKTQEGHIGVLISGNSSKPNQFYILQTKNSYQITDSRNDIIVSYREKYLLLKDVSTLRYYVLTMDGSGPPSSEVELYTLLGKFEGFGLSSHSNSTYYTQASNTILQSPNGPFPPVQAILCDCQENDIPDTDCNAGGGTGSTSCSTSYSASSGLSSSCSVTCGEGYYACCSQ
jgi:hypothetical protein